VVIVFRKIYDGFSGTFSQSVKQNVGSMTSAFSIMFGCRLGGVVVSVLATGPTGREFKPAEVMDF
jgi:hypothetical protein